MAFNDLQLEFIERRKSHPCVSTRPLALGSEWESKKRLLDVCMQRVRAFEQVSQKSPDWQNEPGLVFY
jgi:hypothetical protein